MGRRSWYLRCDNCKARTIKWFDHLSKQEMIEFAENTECSGCGSKDSWSFTEVSDFSGLVSNERYIGLKCTNNSCDLSSRHFYVQVFAAGPEELKYIVRNATCPECGSRDWKYGDCTRGKLKRSHVEWRDNRLDKVLPEATVL